MAVERFITLHGRFGDFEPEQNCTSSSSHYSAEQLEASLELDESRHHEKSDDALTDIGDFYDRSDRNESCKSCDRWTCTNDFIFAVALVVNLCKLLFVIPCTCVYLFHACTLIQN